MDRDILGSVVLISLAVMFMAAAIAVLSLARRPKSKDEERPADANADGQPQEVPSVKRTQSAGVIGAQWAVLSVLLLWLSGPLTSGTIHDASVSPGLRAALLVGVYIVVLCLPGVILLFTSFKNFPGSVVIKGAALVAIPLTIMRFISMALSRLDCGTSCYDKILPYSLELTISLALPFILTAAMAVIVTLTRGNNE